MKHNSVKPKSLNPADYEKKNLLMIKKTDNDSQKNTQKEKMYRSKKA